MKNSVENLYFQYRKYIILKLSLNRVILTNKMSDRTASCGVIQADHASRPTLYNLKMKRKSKIRKST